MLFLKGIDALSTYSSGISIGSSIPHSRSTIGGQHVQFALHYKGHGAQYQIRTGCNRHGTLARSKLLDGQMHGS